MTYTAKIRYNGVKYEFSGRDSQRSKVYKAERVAFARCETEKGHPWSQKIGKGTIEEAEAYVKQVARSATWKKLMQECHRHRPDWIPPVAAKSHGSATGSPYSGLRLPYWARTKPVILHELAHAICPSGVQHHWLFCHIYAKLVSRFMGPEWAQRLRKCFREHRVKFNPPKPKKILTEEQKQVLRERAAKARAVRAANIEAQKGDGLDVLRKFLSF